MMHGSTRMRMANELLTTVDGGMADIDRDQLLLQFRSGHSLVIDY